MINSKELRLGNKFECMDMIQTVFEIEDNTDRGRIIQKNYEQLIMCEENKNQYKPCEINPVPFTEEWKQKLGMKCTGKKRNWYDYSLSNNLEISINEKGTVSLSIAGSNWITLRGVKIIYVHHFQNLITDFENISIK